MNANLFGKLRLGYVVVESNKLEEWRRFGSEALGMHAEPDVTNELVFRIDDHQRRLVVRRGLAEDVVALGWQCDDQAVLDEVRRRLHSCGIEAHEGCVDEARQRGVERFTRIVGPKGLAIELFIQPVKVLQPLVMKASGFVTGASGMGHVAITTREPDSFLAFWQDIFDARVSDYIEDKLDGVQMDFTFLHMNERHHSVALASTRGIRMDPIRTRIHHLNLQAAKLDDVTEAYVRCRQLGFTIANAIGQHPNDRELSFYVVTPSGFEMEFGWSPVVVPLDQAWQTARYRGISLWGHFPENQSMGAKLRRVGRALASLARSEYTLNTGSCHEHKC